MRRHRSAAIAALAATLAIAPPAFAHVTVSPTEASADSYALLNFTVPHGCEGSPTTSIAVKIPEGIYAATPEAVPGWTVVKKMQKLDPPADDGEGGTIPERVDTVTWSGGPLAADQLTQFALSVRLPDAAGQTLAFPVIQGCEQGQTAWIETAAAGEEEPEHPAPAVTLTAAADEGAAEEADSGPSSGRVDAALGLGAGGLALGVIALGVALAGRRKSA
ncbi:MAG: periplasmic copper chaperone [Miltoncostaeaceae bacterium]|jgi:uncharacterized protein YcnI|nr:periplasmic copper chaperone [Miltoncostaeaceae bacterium]